MRSSKKNVYLDHAATTPIDPRVLEEMLPFLREQYGNASSVHRLGRKARFAIEDARERMSAHLGVTPGELVFTSGGTEANNMALKRAAWSWGICLFKSRTRSDSKTGWFYGAERLENRVAGPSSEWVNQGGPGA